jgi:hypothetical protein
LPGNAPALVIFRFEKAFHEDVWIFFIEAKGTRHKHSAYWLRFRELGSEPQQDSLRRDAPLWVGFRRSGPTGNIWQREHYGRAVA